MQINHASAIAANAQQTQSPADLANLTAQSTIYSANIGGKTYTADLSLSDGQYVATIPGLPGIPVTGDNQVETETNFEPKLCFEA